MNQKENLVRSGARWWPGVLIVFTAAAVVLKSEEPTRYAAVAELKQLTIEQLVETPVISASRTPEPWFVAPHAVDVLTDEQIRRSGAVRLPEALRYVTGLDVARASGSSYAISTRGFTSTLGNKMQVMMDGRILYSPLFSGVWWDAQDTLLEDLDRIEVVRGPGGTLWGANAVNGVINVISKSARDTQGTLIMGGGGDEELAFGGVRYGGQISEKSFYRVYVKHQRRDDQALRDGSDARDANRHTQVGFRTDTYLQEGDQLTLQGDLFLNDAEVRNQDDQDHDGGNILARWSRTLEEYGEVRVQTYYDHSMRDVPLQFREERQTFDVDAQHHISIGRRNELVWGVGYRISADDTSENNRSFRFDPDERTIQLFSGFVQDEITVIEDLLKVTLGAKLEHNSFTGWEVQPGGRFAITPSEHHTIWGSVSRAVRSPARGEEDVVFRPNPSGPVTLIGNDDFESEELIAYEVGYRVKMLERVSVDIAGFINDYEKLRTQEPTGPGGPFIIANEREGEIYGGEVAVKFQVTDWARLSASYSRWEQDLRFRSASRDPSGGSAEGNDPDDMALIGLSLNLPGNVEVDLFGRYTDARPRPRVPSYFMLDARVAWHVTKNLELSIVGRNLTDPQHREFGGLATPEVERSVFAKAVLRF